MKIRKNRSFKLNNAGMTLIELLVAIAIIAVALVPLLFSFVNVARYNARAREIQQTTGLAHTIMENCKAYSMEDINTQMTNGTFLTGVTATQTYNDASTGTYYMSNVMLDNSKYDIALTFTPHEFGSASQTSYDIIETKSMNPYLDAVFTPQGTKYTTTVTASTGLKYPAAELDQDAYLSALKAISQAMYIVTEADLGAGNGVILTESQIENSFKESGNPNNGKALKMSREIAILMWDTSSQEQVIVEYDYYWQTTDGKYYYEHTKEDGTTVTYECAASGSSHYSEVIYSNSLTNDPSHPTKIESVYFFYYPGYKGLLSVFPFESDEIIVSNQLADGTRTIDVYLIKQKNPAYSDSNLDTLESTYTTKVEGLYNGSYTSGTNIYHNFDVNLGGGSSTPYDVNTWFTSNLNIMPKLVLTDNKVLMYDVELKIYDAGAYDMANHVLDATAQPVLTMDGTTLDW